MARRRGQGRRRTRGGQIRPLGLVLAIFALLCQSLVLLLPQPAMAMPTLSALPADAALFSGGYVLCQDDDSTAPAYDDHQAPCPHCADCPVCQAFHGAGGLVPPTLPALPVPGVQGVAFVPTVPHGQPLRLVARAHQPRAPPGISSL
ncbi:MAG TPA: DUF2946 family protein [Aliidongia sp.]|uniref:DUF2946 family protein n=1 Tax=Aliidongia sp. TaxID=1914230 RepID=UPI002DDD500E|nr:DUF2946 family protein [Aliidongia sp.]HEV2673741.1 DUF2946 family protein [Aliidongia sp.]